MGVELLTVGWYDVFTNGDMGNGWREEVQLLSWEMKRDKMLPLLPGSTIYCEERGGGEGAGAVGCCG